MKLFYLRTNILFFIASLSVGNFVNWYVSEPMSAEVFIVKASRELKPNITDKELYEFIKDGNDYPGHYAIEKKVGIEYAIADLYVEIGKENRVTVNNHDVGTTNDLEPLKRVLSKALEERNKKAFWIEEVKENRNRVFFVSRLSTKYGDVRKVIDAIKESGADQVILRIEYLHE